jgi:subtilisin family serine protease
MKKKYAGLFLSFICTAALVGCFKNPAIVEVEDGNTFPQAAAGRTARLQVQDQYIVMFNADVDDPASAANGLAKAHGMQVGHVYSHALKGFSARIPAPAMAGLAKNPAIAVIEPDLVAHAVAQQLPTGVDRIEAEPPPDPPDACDVDIAIIDTGIDTDHEDLTVVGGRHFYSAVSWPWVYSYQDDQYDDDNGHGSHVAGIAAAKNNDVGVVGVAPGARLWAVKVLDNEGNGYVSDIIAGLDWIAARADSIEVANMSLSATGKSSSMRAAVQGCVNAGIVLVAAAGNDYSDVFGRDGRFNTKDDIIPAAFPEVAAISALADADGLPGGLGGATSWGNDDAFAGFSNYSTQALPENPVSSPGAAIDLILPGVDIYSCDMNGGYATHSGTSMASPHAAGLAARYIDAASAPTNSAADVYAIRQALIDEGRAQNGPEGLAEHTDPDNNPENLGWVGTASPPPPPPPPPDVTDIAVVSVIAPSGVDLGTSATVSVTVKNVGTVDVLSAIGVTLKDTDKDGNEISVGTRSISSGLAAATEAILDFTWTPAVAGGHTLTGSHDVADDNSANDAASTVSNVTSEPPPSGTVHVGDIDGSSRAVGKSGKWQATAAVAVHDGIHAAVAGATVSGTWSGAASGSVSGVTGSDGTVSLVSGNMSSGTSATFTVTGVELAGSEYVPDSNHDDEGDSDGTTIVIAK